MTHPHYFIALSLTKSLKQKLAVWQKDLKTELSYKQWTHMEDFHITLKFLGEVDDKIIGSLNQKLKALSSLESFHTRVHSLGTFGHPKRPRVLWAGVDLTTNLSSLQKRVEELAVETGFQKEKRIYKPHITLAKKWTNGDGERIIEKFAKKVVEQSFPLYIDSVVLYQIHPKNLPKYRVIHEYQLKE